METHRLTRRELVVHDALAFLTLTLVTAVLFVVTWLLFRSFSAHRIEQAKDWEARGRAALSGGRAEEAVEDFRTALTFAPGTRAYELLLAQSLAAAGPKHTDEAYNYFLELWDTQPGDGQINLALARLEARRGDQTSAVRFYRAAIDGRWDENGSIHRREERLELARYLIAQHSDDGARVDLLVVASNWSDDAAVQAEVAGLLAQAGDTGDAMARYQKAIALKPDDATIVAAGKLAYQAGDFSDAAALLQRGVHGSNDTGDAAMRDKAERLAAMEPSNNLSAAERVRRIVALRALAKRRWESCTKQTAIPIMWMSLTTRWKAEEATASIPVLLVNPALEDLAVQLAYDTESATSQMCGAPTGDDALALTLAQVPGGPR